MKKPPTEAKRPEMRKKMKVCTKCGEDKPLSEYNKRKGAKDGHRNDCKVCRKAEKKAHYEANREKVLAERKAYREANREKIATYFKAYYEANREEIAAAKKAYYEANREKLAAYSKAYQEANREQRKASRAERYATDPEYRARLAAANIRRRRLLDSAVQEPYLREDIFERDGWTCQLCQEPIDPELQWPERGYASIDHIVPVSFGGDDTPDNVQAAHLGCNSSKNNRVELEDQAMLAKVAG